MTMLKKGFFSLAAIAVMTGFVACSDDGEIGDGDKTKPEEKMYSVVYDAFETNKFGDAGVGESDYSAQSYLGYQLGGFVDESNDSLVWGGGFWYAYTSGDGVKITNAAGDVDIVAGDKEGPDGDSNAAMKNMLGDDSLGFVIDYTENGGSPYAGVGLGIGGDANHLPESTGGKQVEFSVEWTTDLQKAIVWNLSTLKSISFKGSAQGPALVNVKGVDGDSKGAEKPIYFELHGDMTPSTSEMVAFDFTVEVTDIDGWDDIKEQVEGIEIQLLNESPSGKDLQTSDKLIMKMDKITLDFADSTKAFEALPFLNITK